MLSLILLLTAGGARSQDEKCRSSYTNEKCSEYSLYKQQVASSKIMVFTFMEEKKFNNTER